MLRTVWRYLHSRRGCLVALSATDQMRPRHRPTAEIQKDGEYGEKHFGAFGSHQMGIVVRGECARSFRSATRRRGLMRR